MKDAVLERVKAIYTDSNSKSIRVFAESIGIHKNTMTQQLNGERALSLDTIIAILTSNESISAEWLMRGEGEMYRDAGQEMSSETEKNLNKLVAMLEDRIESLEAELNEYREGQKNVG